MEERPEGPLEGDYELDVSKADAEGEFQRYVVRIRRLSNADTESSTRSLLQHLQAQYLLGPQELRRSGGDVEREAELDIGDVLTLLNEADQDLHDSISNRNATRENIESLRREIERRSH